MDNDSKWVKLGSVAIMLVLVFGYIAVRVAPDLAVDWYNEGNHTASARVWELTCQLGDSRSCYFLGIQYRRGEGVPQDFARATKAYQKACDDNIYEACTNLGVIWGQGLGGTVDMPKARALYAKGCGETGPVHDTTGCSNAAVVAETPEVAARFLLRACEASDLASCMYLGRVYHSADGVPQDEAKAESFSRQACTGGLADACFDLGISAQEGYLRAPDETRARQLFEQACTGGSAMGCTNLGFYLQRGQGGAADRGAALAAWEKGCAANDSIGCAQLGDALSQLDGGAQERARVLPMFAQACDAGTAGGCVGLGTLRLADDRKAALELYAKGCEQGGLAGCARVLRDSEAERAELVPRVMAAFDDMLKRFPKDPGPLSLRAEFEMNQGRNEDALADFTRVLELDPKNASALNNRAWMKIRLHDFEGAVTDARASVDLERDAHSLGTLCWALAGKQERAEALIACTASLELEPGEPLNSGMVAFLEKRAKDAKREWAAALKRVPLEEPAVAHFMSR